MTSSSVIRTRLYPPVSRAPLIERARLLDLLQRNRDRTLILVAAPAGFGKTTLLGQWFERRRRAGEHCCWCSLDRDDSEPQRFLRHLLSALRTLVDVGSGLLQRLDNTLIGDISSALPALINEVAELPHELVLFMDDFHWVRSAEVNRFVEQLVLTAPANLHVVLASRLRPPLSLSSLRVRTQLFEITANHLRFDAGEADDFIRRAARLDLSAVQLDRLYEHSEGWAAGLQLASLSLQDAARRDAFIGSFSGSLREIADYLASDVLNQQEPEVRDFLLRTAILDRVCAAAAAAVTGCADAGLLLKRAEAGNLFLVPLDETGEWFRYHHLFQEFLLAELRRSFPDAIVSLYRRAADWFAEAGLLNEAVNYALLSGDMLKVGQLVHSGTLERLAMDGKMTALLSWVSSIPQHIKARFPRLLIQECIALSHLYRSTAAADVAAQAEAAIERLPLITDYPYTAPDLERIREEAVILPFMVAFCRDDLETVDTTPLASLHSRDDLVLGIAHNFIGWSLLGRHHLAEAERHFARARVHHVSKLTYYGAVFSDCFAAACRLLQFRLHDAHAHALAAERLVQDIEGGHVAGLAQARVMQAVVLYEWNRVDEALDLLRAHLHTIEAAGQVAIAQLGLVAQARCHAALGRPERALADLDRCLEISAHAAREYISLVVEGERRRLAFLGGGNDGSAVDEARIGALLDSLRADWGRTDFAALLLQFQNAVLAGRYESVAEPLKTFRRLCQGRNLLLADLDLLMLSALGCAGTGRIEPALDHLEAAVALACTQNGVRRFLHFGEGIRALLPRLEARYAEEGTSLRRNFIAQVEAAFAAAPRRDGAGDDTRLVEPLSSREMEILELMARGDSNAAISARLFISENTVKWHIKNVFAKLGVTNRTAAVAAARRRQILAQPAAESPVRASL